MKILLVLIALFSINNLCFAQISVAKTGEKTANPNNTALWEISPLAGMTSSLGKLNVIIPEINNIITLPNGNTITIPIPAIQDSVGIRQSNEYIKYKLPKYIAAGTRNIWLNGVTYSIPIVNGKETRLKAGFFTIWRKSSLYDSQEGIGDEYIDVMTDISTYGGGLGSNSDDEGYNWEWEVRKKGDDRILRKGKKGTTLALPPGEYILKRIDPIKDREREYYAKITDGKWVFNGERIQDEQSGNQMKSTVKWTITPGAPGGIMGALIFDFPDDTNWDMAIFQLPEREYIRTVSQGEKRVDLDLSAGKFELVLNNVPVKDVPIEAGQQTSLKTGVLQVNRNSSYTIWDATGKNHFKTENSGSRLVLPVGKYVIKIGGANVKVEVKDGETIQL